MSDPERPGPPIDARFAQNVVIGDHNTVYQGVRPPVEWPVTIGWPPAPADHLQPRHPEMAALRDALAPGGTAVLTPAGRSGSVLSGLGGVGKSQLAAQFWRDWRAGPGATGLMAWVSAGDRAAVLTAFAQIAVAVAGPGTAPVPDDPDAAAARLLDWCDRTERSWLIVLDDLADPADMQRLWPSGPHGVTLVTTRRTDAALRASGRRMIPVGTFTPEQSRAYLRAKLDGDPALLVDDAVVDGLAADLQHLPLALAQAAAFVLDRAATGEDCARYRERFADRRAELPSLFPADALADDYQRTVAVTLSLSVDAADLLPPAGLARPALELAGTLDPNGFPLDVFTADPARAYLHDRRDAPAPGSRRSARRREHRAPGSSPGSSPSEDDPATADERDCRDAVAHLARLSLLNVDAAAGPRAVRVHALVGRASRESTPDAPAATLASADALLSVWTEDPRDPQVGQAMRDNGSALVRCGGDHLWHGGAHTVLSRLADSLTEAGQAAAAREHLTGMLATARERLGPEHEDTLHARYRLANARGQVGDASGAVDDLVPLVDDLTRVCGADTPMTLYARTVLANWRGTAGDPTGAIADYTALVEDRTRLFGADDPDTLTTRGALANWRGFVGSPAETAASYAALVEDLRRVLGPEHPETLTGRANHAVWLGESGDARGAVAAYVPLVADRDRMLGAEHPATLGTRSNLAHMRGLSGDTDGAVADGTALVEDLVRILGADHPNTLAARNNLAHWRGESGDTAGAVADYRALVEDERRVHGPEHPSTLTARNNLARSMGQDGDIAGCLAAFDELVPDVERILGPDHPFLLTMRGSVAGWRAQAGDVAAAAAVFADLIAERARILGPEHPDTLNARANFAHWRGNAGDAAGAAADYAELLPVVERVFGPDHPNTRSSRTVHDYWRMTAELAVMRSLIERLGGS